MRARLSRVPSRVGSREGMVFPAHRTTAGLVLLAEMDADELEAVATLRATAQRLERELSAE